MKWQEGIVFKPLVSARAEVCVSGAPLHAFVKQDQSPVRSSLSTRGCLDQSPVPAWFAHFTVDSQ